MVVDAPRDLERDLLVGELRRHGLRFLAPADAEPQSVAMPIPQLIAAMAAHRDPRVRHALVPLLMRHPEFAEAVADGVQRLDAADARRLKELYTAAAALQRMWRTRLSFYLDEVRELPDVFSQELGLPPVELRFGKLTLAALCEASAFNLASSLAGMVEHLFFDLKTETAWLRPGAE